MLQRCELHEQNNKSSMEYGYTGNKATVLPVQVQKGFGQKYNSFQKSYSKRDDQSFNRNHEKQAPKFHNAEPTFQQPTKETECFYCHKKGHFIKDCRKRLRNNQQHSYPSRRDDSHMKRRTFNNISHFIGASGTDSDHKNPQSTTHETYRDDGSDTDTTNLAHFLENKSIKTVLLRSSDMLTECLCFCLIPAQVCLSLAKNT